MKKIISMLLALAMMFSLAMPAMAVEITGDTSKNVTATYNPVITIGDITLSEAEATVPSPWTRKTRSIMSPFLLVRCRSSLPLLLRVRIWTRFRMTAAIR